MPKSSCKLICMPQWRQVVNACESRWHGDKVLSRTRLTSLDCCGVSEVTQKFSQILPCSREPRHINVSKNQTLSRWTHLRDIYNDSQTTAYRGTKTMDCAHLAEGLLMSAMLDNYMTVPDYKLHYTKTFTGHSVFIDINFMLYSGTTDLISNLLLHEFLFRKIMPRLWS